MKHKDWFLLLMAGFLLGGACLSAEEGPGQTLDHEFQAAVALYDASKFAEAATRLEARAPRAPKSFEIQELLGLAYAAQSQSTRALEHLQTAARLKPDSSTARTNLAAALDHAGKREQAFKEFRKALELAPGDYDANHNLGEFYVQSGKIAEARPLLEKAQQIDPSSYENGYDLAQADFLTARIEDSRAVVGSLLKQKDTGELHELLGQIEEKDGKFLEAAKQFEIAAHMDPSEENLFTWGSEYLLHRTYEPAIDIFEQASQRYPKSPRLRMALGMALYSRGRYDDAIKSLIAAADLDPTDPRCYLFLAKEYDMAPAQAEDVMQRFRRYASLKPADARAQYYYAMSLWKGKQVEGATVDLAAVEALLKSAVKLDDSLAEAHLGLGNLYSDQHQWEQSAAQYQRAIELDANLPDAHYRLAQDYLHVGKKEQAQAELGVYQKQRAEHLAEMDKHAEVLQFVYSETGGAPAKQ